MTTRPLTTRLVRRLSIVIRPLRRRAAITQLSTLDALLLRDIGLGHGDVDAMRRMW